MVILTFLKSLSYVGAVNLLLKEGYIEKRTIEVSDSKCEKKFIYPYSLYGKKGNIINTVYYIEFCESTEDNEYADGRLTWEPTSTLWTREKYFAM